MVWLWNVENLRFPLLPSSGSSYYFCLSLSMWWQSLRAGPSFNPMYFMIMSLRKSIKALPSISCGKAKQSIYYKIYSNILFWKSAKNNWITRNPENLTCFLKSSACGPSACGSASRTNCITSSILQDDGLLLDVLVGSFSAAWWSGPVVELAARKRAKLRLQLFIRYQQYHTNRKENWM